MNSIASNSPIVREIVFRIISSGEIEGVSAKHRIDNDIVPSISHKTHTFSSGLQESILKVSVPLKHEVGQHHFQRQVVVQQGPQAILEGYGRLNELIRNPSISTIEYVGEGLPIKITSLGKIQSTNIILSKEETESILKYISSRTRIPVENQVFKVSIDNLLFNAIISQEMGTRFLIKKNFQISPDYSEAFK